MGDVTRRLGRPAHVGLLACLFAACVCGGAVAATRTDVVVLANGDRITGEILTLSRGQLEFKTDDAAFREMLGK